MALWKSFWRWNVCVGRVWNLTVNCLCDLPILYSGFVKSIYLILPLEITGFVDVDLVQGLVSRMSVEIVVVTDFGWLVLVVLDRVLCALVELGFGVGSTW